MAQSNVKQQLLHSVEWTKAQRGEAYDGNVPELVAARQRYMRACDALNDPRDYSWRNQVELWRREPCQDNSQDHYCHGRDE
ncbi:hypothetical protein MHUMG1_08500 [Metarhizium humberi]|uniref:Maltose/galactoside acetyltransferase domain-containing protein n=1 Tax=Metarhizium humberi TaxID=2596975 RepID=A0A9P8S4Y9_9HYPO|nr:hypothetical protein MHUMG1_08500 [Metarhizium humberi]